MNQKLQLLVGSLLIFSTIAVAAQSTPPQAEKTTCCMVANGCAEHTDKDLKKLDAAVATLDQARHSNDPKALHAALEVAYKSLSEVRQDEGKTELAMKSLYNHLTKVEEKAAKLRDEQRDLNDLIDGTGLDSNATFIIN